MANPSLPIHFHYNRDQLLEWMEKFDLPKELLEELVEQMHTVAYAHRDQILLDALGEVSQIRKSVHRLKEMSGKEVNHRIPFRIVQQGPHNFQVEWPNSDHEDIGFYTWGEAFAFGASEGGQLVADASAMP